MSQPNTDEALVVFTPSGKRGRFPVGTPLLQAARYLNVDIDSVCGARGICGRCQIFVSEGEFAKFGITSSADSLEPITFLHILPLFPSFIFFLRFLPSLLPTFLPIFFYQNVLDKV